MKTRPQEITEMLKQKKTNSWSPVGPTRARKSKSAYFSSSIASKNIKKGEGWGKGALRVG